MPVYVAMPDGDGPFGAVVVLQEIFGVNSHIRDIPNELRPRGLCGIGPSLVSSTGSLDLKPDTPLRIFKLAVSIRYRPRR